MPKPAARGRGTPKPRAGVTRKSKEERDQFAKDEAARMAARAADHEAANRGARGGRVINRGSRAGATPIQRGGGVFGGGVTPTQSRQKYEAFAERLDADGKSRGADANEDRNGDADMDTAIGAAQSRAGRTGGAKSTARGGASTGMLENETFEIATDEDADDGPNRDIERIWISSDDEEDIVRSTSRKGKQKSAGSSGRPPRSGLGLRPVRAPHTERAQDDQDGQDTLLARKKRTLPGKKLDTEPQELSSDDRDGEAMDEEMSSAMPLKDPVSSPEAKKRTLKKPISAPRPGRDTRLSPNESPEEKAERLRVQEDSEKLCSIFNPHGASNLDEVRTDDAGDMRLGLPAEARYMLFQLPPLTPFLNDLAAASGPTEQDIKTEPSANTATNTTIDLDTIPDAPSTAPAAAVQAIKIEPDTSSSKPPSKLKTEGFLTANEPTRLPRGIIGKLNVHKSGKVTLDWGGTDMQVTMGTEVDFLQDVVEVISPGSKAEAETEAADMTDGVHGNLATQGTDGDKANLERGQARLMGRVQQKFVLVPDWAKLYD
jgi:DNA-directed RNA polymerase III subunit RPC4